MGASVGHFTELNGDPTVPCSSHTLYDMVERRMRVLTVSVPPEAAEDFDRIAARRDATAASCSGRCSPSTGRTSRAGRSSRCNATAQPEPHSGASRPRGTSRG